MILTAVVAFLAGFFLGNGLPYYVQGSVGRGVNPSPFPDSPAVNVTVGWVALIIGGICLYLADVPAHPIAGVAAGAVGVLLVGLIHSREWQNDPWHKHAAG
jgi:hypothetical protein